VTATRRPVQKAAARGSVRTDKPIYAVAALVLFGVEVLIALFLHDGFVRPLVGDALVVGLIYLTTRAVTPLRVLPAVAIALGIAFAVEFAQAFNLVDVLGLSGNAFARVVLGTSYDPRDFIAYTAGGMGVLLIEAARKTRML
jgi:hypothetical protein